MIGTAVYPAVLWPLDEPVLDGVSDEDKQWERTMLSFHCDMRYGKDDMERLADLIFKHYEAIRI